MEAVIVVEIFDHDGRLIGRERLSSFPAAIGRGYANDIILDDPYVSPRHAVIEHTDERNLVLRDLESLNGTTLAESRTRIGVLPLNAEVRVRMGGTTLRFVRSDQPVADAVPLRATRTFSQRKSRLGRVAAMSFLLWYGLQLLSTLKLSSWHQLTRSYQLGIGIAFFLGPVLVLSVWSGLWNIASRLVRGRGHFFDHFLTALLALFIADAGLELLKYLEFCFDLPNLASALEIVLLAGTCYALLASHLRFATTGKRTARNTAIVLTVLLAGIAALLVYESGLSFSGSPKISAVVRPASLLVARGGEPRSFFAELPSLQSELHKLAERKSGGTPFLP